MQAEAAIETSPTAAPVTSPPAPEATQSTTTTSPPAPEVASPSTNDATPAQSTAAAPVVQKSKKVQMKIKFVNQPAEAALKFCDYLFKLKETKRSGWKRCNVPDPESVADHSYRMAMLAMLAPQMRLDRDKYVIFCVTFRVLSFQMYAFGCCARSCRIHHR